MTDKTANESLFCFVWFYQSNIRVNNYEYI